MAYKPIESYGVIGDLHTVALVGMDGSIDWCCLPHFDSPSIFAAILDEHKGGFFKIASLYESMRPSQLWCANGPTPSSSATTQSSALGVSNSSSCRGATRAPRHNGTRNLPRTAGRW